MGYNIKIKHNPCNTVFWTDANSFLHKKNNKCPTCYPNDKKTAQQFQLDLDTNYGEGRYTIIGYYVNAKSLTEIRCNICNHTWKTKPNWLLTNRSGCPYCNSPKGETIISKILDTFNISYESQKTFDDLKDKDCLSYDFYVPGQNILIEYQGLQHYQPVDYFGGEAKFKLQQKHDKMKADYAKDYNYNLIVIPYTNDYQKLVDEEENKMHQEEMVEIEPININLSDYDIIILGTPVWWYTMAPVVRSFLSGNNLNGKKVIAFITNGGWIGHTVEDIKKYCEIENYINLKFNSDKIQNEKSLSDWINSL